MSKYLLSAGVVWVFLCFVVGVIILMMPESKPELERALPRAEFNDTTEKLSEVKPSLNKATATVQVDGTPLTSANAAGASVQVKAKK